MPSSSPAHSYGAFTARLALGARLHGVGPGTGRLARAHRAHAHRARTHREPAA